MTDPHDLDELASAHLDGTTSPEEAALLADDPALRTRVHARADELRAVRQALAEPLPVDPSRRDAAIAAALSAFDAERSPDTGGATVTPLAPRRGLSPRAVRALSAAAVVLLLALLVPLLANIERDDETASFNSTGAAIEDAAGADPDSAREETSETLNRGAEEGGQSAFDGGDAALSALGSYADLDALAGAVAAAEEGSPAPASGGSGDDSRCTPPTSTSGQRFLAEVAGVPVEVTVTTDADGTRTMTVRDRDTCQQLDVREL